MKHTVALAVVVAMCLSGAFMLFPGAAPAADYDPVKREGTLTEIDRSGNLVIDDFTFMMNKEVRVMTMDKKHNKINSSLKKIKLPARVSYEFVDTKKGPVIRSITELID